MAPATQSLADPIPLAGADPAAVSRLAGTDLDGQPLFIFDAPPGTTTMHLPKLPRVDEVEDVLAVDAEDAAGAAARPNVGRGAALAHTSSSDILSPGAGERPPKCVHTARPMSLSCARDRMPLRETKLGEATVDVCGKCEGTFFESGEMFAAAGLAADPSSWDRPETGGAVKESKLHCPRCELVLMHAQDVGHEGKHVEVDRCGKCRGVWLDKSELDTLVAIGKAMQPLVAAEQAKAEAELAKLGDVSFDTPLTKWKVVAAALLVAIVGASYYYATRPPPPRPRDHDYPRAKGEEGCPCGCDRSAMMAAELRRQGGGAASKAIESTLATISARENAGYITERMILHRLRLLALADELRTERPTDFASIPHLGSKQERSAPIALGAPIADESLRISAQLVVHGERLEIVKGEDKLITPSFLLRLQIENLRDHERSVARPTIRAAGSISPSAAGTKPTASDNHGTARYEPTRRS